MLSFACDDDYAFDPADYTRPEWAPELIAQRQLESVAPFQGAEEVSSFTSNQTPTAVEARLYRTSAAQDEVKRHYEDAFAIPGWKLVEEPKGPVWEEAVAHWEHELRGPVAVTWHFPEESLEIILQANPDRLSVDRHTLAVLWSEGCDKSSAQSSESSDGGQTNCFIVEAYDYRFISWP
jgi:hypothetical protein